MKSRFFSGEMKRNREKRVDFWAYLSITCFILFFVFLSFWRHDSLQSYLNDIGACDQAIWNTLNGKFLQITTSMYEENNFLGGHFSPILLFFVPFYAIYASPKWLLLFQALAVGISALPVYWLAKEKLKSSGGAIVFLFSYLLNPFLHNALLYDFHEVVLATAFASWAFYFLEKRKNKAFIISSIFLAICQEHLVLLVFMMGLYAFFIQKRSKFGFWVSCVSSAYFILVIGFLMPGFSHTGKPALLEENATYGNRYRWLGSTIPEIIKNIAYYPDVVMRVLFSTDRLLYLFYLIMPIFSLALYAWPLVIAVPILLIGLLSSNPMTYNIYFYHSAIIIPFVYFSAIFTFRRWFLAEKFLCKLFLGAIIFSSIYSFYRFSLVGSFNGQVFSLYRPNVHSQRIVEVKKMIPKEASLSVQHNLGPHFSHREEVYRFPVKKDEAEYVLLDKTNPYGKKSIQHFSSFEYSIQMDVAEWQKNIEEFRVSLDHELIYEKDGYLIFRKKK